MKPTSNPANPECCECGLSLPLDDPMRGEVIVCRGCNADLEVLNYAGKWYFELAPEVEEDWGE